MVETARDARAVFLRTSEVAPETSREYRTEPGTASTPAETKGPKPPHSTLPIGRDRASPLSTPQKPAGSRPLHLGQRLWGPSGLRGGDERTQTTCLARSQIEPVSVRPPCLSIYSRRPEDGLDVRVVRESDSIPELRDVAQSFLNCATTRSARIGTQYLAKNVWCLSDSAYLR